MNRDEQVVFEYLKRQYGENVVFEPKPNITPDFSVNSSIAVEVRRLNQHFFESKKPEGLEKLSFPLFDAFREVLDSLNYPYTGKSYWVFIDYKRPLSFTIHQAKRDMEVALKVFLDLQVSSFPYEISVNPEITLSFYESNLNNGKLFTLGGSDDFDAGGWVISVYVENIRYCIDEKSVKISNRLREYNEWWLYLVDHMGFWLDGKELSEVVKLVGNTGNFDKVFVLDFSGENILTAMSKRNL